MANENLEDIITLGRALKLYNYKSSSPHVKIFLVVC
jgi:hypothetical protein